jgi:predicted transcriptional regulator
MFELGRRERQILEAVYRLGRASVSEVRAELADPPSYSAVRTMLGLLEQKGFLRHEQDGLRYVYLPTLAPAKARRSALQHVVDTFFGGSAREAIAALLELPDGGMSSAEERRILRRIVRARREGR